MFEHQIKKKNKKYKKYNKKKNKAYRISFSQEKRFEERLKSFKKYIKMAEKKLMKIAAKNECLENRGKQTRREKTLKICNGPRD